MAYVIIPIYLGSMISYRPKTTIFFIAHLGLKVFGNSKHPLKTRHCQEVFGEDFGQIRRYFKTKQT